MSWRTTAATRLFGIDVPIVLAPFGGVSSVELTALVSHNGGLGSYGLYGYDAERILSTARDIRARTDRPFAFNVWVPHDNAEQVQVDQDAFDRYLGILRPYFEELGAPLPERPAQYLPAFEDQVEAVLEARPAVLSFVFGAPAPEVLDRAKERGIVTVGSATTVEEAVVLDRAGLEAIVATGSEAAGHRVSFLRPAEDSLVGAMALVPQVVDAVSVPVIAAGGIADGRGVAAALILGATAVQIGSAFLATSQSAAAPVYRDALRGAGAGQTVLTRAMSGRLARGIPNRLTRELADPELVAPFPVQNWLTGRFRSIAAERGIPDLMSLWAGQASPLISESDAVALMASLLRETDVHLRR
jgi:nitronate monooxygenase